MGVFRASWFWTGGLVIGSTLSACTGQNASSPTIPPLSTTSDASAPGALPLTVLTGSVPTHIATWAYDEYWAEGGNASASQVRQYVTYAEGGPGNSKAVADCSGSGTCYSVWYMNTNLMYGSTVCPDSQSAPVIAASSENWFIHLNGYLDSSHRVHGTYSASCSAGSQTAPVWLLNNTNSSAEAYYKNYLQKNADAWNYYFMDSTSGTIVDQTYGPGGGFCGGKLCYTTQEWTTDASIVASHSSMANALNHINGSAMQFFFNGMSFDGAQNANDFTILRSTNRFVGAACENCIVNANVLKPQMYAPVLNAMATIDNLPSGAFVLLSTGNATAGSSTQIAQRLVTTAVIWLGYKDGHTIVWPNLEYNLKNLAVWPEDRIYPSQPLESMTSGANDIQVATNVWRREFGTCYNNGIAIGGCAAILNGNTSPVVVKSSWLQKTYLHGIQLVGGDALSGGSVALKSLVFTANSTVIPTDQALLLVP